EKFRYPEGYFATEAQLLAAAALASPTPLPFLAEAMRPAPVQPEFHPAPSLSPSPLPSSSGSPAVATSVPPVTSPSPSKAQAKASPSPTVSPAMTAAEAQVELEKTAAKNNIDLPKEDEINKKVMKDFAVYARNLKDQGKLDFNKPFEIVIEAELDEKGKLKDPKFTKKAGDENLVELFGHMVSALNDSGFLGYLRPLNEDNPGSKIVFTIKQGESEVLATVETEASSADRASILARGFNGALVLGVVSRSGKVEEALLRNTSVEPKGKNIVFNFTMPRQAVVDLIKKQLEPDKPG
ncbi:MAG TPA: hypothetical protein VGC61_04660, partial [Pyrinomonadaceae bacterium]